MKKPYRVLFVCMGNICRSPAGENVFRRMVEEEGLSDVVEIDSAGTLDYHTGKKPDSRMCGAAEKRGMTFTGAARQVRDADLEEFDLILAMDEENLSELRDREKRSGSDAEATGRLLLFCEFCSEHEDEEVPDPYYGGASGFDYVLDLMEDGCAGILEEVKKTKI